jgi:hypothetical protein
MGVRCPTLLSRLNGEELRAGAWQMTETGGEQETTSALREEAGTGSDK